MVSDYYLAIQKKLKLAIHQEAPTIFENLVAALLGKLLDLPIIVAKSGFQHGGDAGSVGQQGRRLRIECKRYRDTTSLSDRELLGEIDHAIARDGALEAWILAATRNVSEQLAQDLTQKGEKEGIPVIILDWRDNTISDLAALFAYSPDIVKEMISEEAGVLASELKPISEDCLIRLKKNLQSWELGFGRLCEISHERLNRIWDSPRESNAKFGQNVAGGAEHKRIKRLFADEQLSSWWGTKAGPDSPAVVIGLDGVGKTWAAIDWLITHADEMPIILAVSSSTSSELKSCSEMEILEFMARRLYELTAVRSQEHWLHRLINLFKRPVDEGPVITLFFDGLNQESSVNWLGLLKSLQGETFSGCIRVIVSTRNHFFNEKLGKLRGLIDPPILISLTGYDTGNGGELDQMLAYEDLKRSDLHPELIEIACIPRLFKLVIRYRDKLIEAGQITVHRLLWEYGRDTFGERSGISFSENEWRSWLKGVAKEYLSGITTYSEQSISAIASRGDLKQKDVYCRLSDIVDGHFATDLSNGDWVLDQTIVSHALGAALLSVLDNNEDNVKEELTKWLDPIDGFDQRAEILRAAVSILVEKGNITRSQLASVLVTAWLQTQNVSENHQQELAALSPLLWTAFLDAIEQSKSSATVSARLSAVNALRAIPRNDLVTLEGIVEHTRKWFKVVSRGVRPNSNQDNESEKNRAKRILRLIGVDESKKNSVLGVEIELVDWDDEILQATVPAILEGFPLATITPIFEAVAIAFAVGEYFDRGWKGISWLCLLNEVDPEETTIALRELSEAIRNRKLEYGIHPQLPTRIAELLLWLTCQYSDEKEAISIAPRINHPKLYENDYLVNPARSFLPLERRHAHAVLCDTKIQLYHRIQRAERLWLDPGFIPPRPFIDELRIAIQDFDISKLNTSRNTSSEDLSLRKLQPALARCAPDVLLEIEYKRLLDVTTCNNDSRYWKVNAIYENLFLQREGEVEEVRKIPLPQMRDTESHDSYFANALLVICVRNLSATEQYKTIIDADLKFISDDFDEVLLPLSSKGVDELINHCDKAGLKQKKDLLALLTTQDVTFSEFAWSWLLRLITEISGDDQALLFRTLALNDTVRFGKFLNEINWSWSPEENLLINHYGSIALIKATLTESFENIIHRIVPWHLLESARVRGSKPEEVKYAAKLFNISLMNEDRESPDPGADIIIDRAEFASWPFSFSTSLRKSKEETENPALAMKNAINPDEQFKKLRHSAEVAVNRIREAQRTGAYLYHAEVDKEDLLTVLKNAPETFEKMIDGFEEPTDDFRRRVLLAETVFMTVCEILLASDPAKGVVLWKILREIITSKILGVAQVDEFLHILFRVPDSVEVNELREKILGIENCNTDKHVCHISITMSHNDRVDLLKNVIESDCNSEYSWKKKRGIVLDGFSVYNFLPVEGAWPEGEVRGTYDGLKLRSARFKFIEACARHWWQAYLKAKSAEEAYSAWVLFLNTADNRAWIWMRDDIGKLDDKSEFFQQKINHAQINKSALKRAMAKHFDKLDSIFLGKDIFSPLGPWH